MTDASATACSHAGHGQREARGTLILAGVAAALLASPLFVARIIDPSIAEGQSICPFLHATGVPCPACGATRAFVLFAHGDGAGAMRFNWMWIVLWAVAVLALAGFAWRRFRGRPAVPRSLKDAGRWLQRHPAAVVVLPFALIALPWAVAIANIDAIR